MTDPSWFLLKGFVKHDLQRGKSWTIELPECRNTSETPLAFQINAKDEDDAYPMSFIIDENTQTPECTLIDCKKFSDDPAARIALLDKNSCENRSMLANRKLIRDGQISN